MSFIRFSLAVSNFLAWLAVVIINGIAGSGKLNNISTGAVSNDYPTAITPDGWAFSIWGLIFTLTGIFSIYQLLPEKRKSNFIFRSIGPFFLVNCLFTFAWPFCWHWRAFWVSVGMILALLLSLIVIYIRLRIDYSEKGRERTDEEGNIFTTWDYWILQVPFSVFLGWITVATIANIMVALSASNVDMNMGFRSEVWSIVLQTLCTIISLGILRFRYDFFYSGVIAWAQFAIATKHFDQPDVSTAGFVNGSINTAGVIATIFCLLINYFYSSPYRSILN